MSISPISSASSAYSSQPASSAPQKLASSQQAPDSVQLSSAAMNKLSGGDADGDGDGH